MRRREGRVRVRRREGRVRVRREIDKEIKGKKEE